MGFLWALEWRKKKFLGSFHFRETWYWSRRRGGGAALASREARANFFPGFLGRSVWYQIYGLFMGFSDMQSMTTPKLPLKSYQHFKEYKKLIFFSQK